MMKLTDDIHNFYENLVVEHITALKLDETDQEYTSDLICLTLNQLPPRYIRHEVDMVYYQPASERQHMLMQVFLTIRVFMSKFWLSSSK